MSARFTIEDLQRKGFAVTGDQAAKQNKVRGALKSEVNGIKFASKLELYFYNLLKAVKIEFEFQVEYELQPAFLFHGKKIQPIKIRPDFYLPDFDMIVDTKGFAMEKATLKYKMLKYKFHIEGKNTSIELPSTKEECEKLINQLINRKLNLQTSKF